MTTDLFYLTLTALLCAALWIPYIVGNVSRFGLLNAGDYQNAGLPKKENSPAWLARANRAHVNLVEGFSGFAALVLVAHVTGEADSVTAMASMIYFWVRVSHAVVYMMGIPFLRTLLFAASFVCQLTIGYQILT
ncbi:MAG: MAPEG family protein [Gammaproteobacteria bacterium]|nr:MAPEG family protein [Gammaproteobacteria bacterium]NKB64963.1 MAPEG family protein [Gammaproteobacteria bacterium]